MSFHRNKYSAVPLKNIKKKNAENTAVRHTTEPPTLQVPLEKKMRRHVWLQLLMTFGLPLLFLIALFVPNTILRLVFIGVTLFSILAMYVLKAFVKNARGTLSFIYIALTLVIVVALFTSGAFAPPKKEPQKVDVNSIFSSSSALDVPNLPSNADTTPPQSTEMPISEAQIRLEEFMEYWVNNQSANMLTICRPNWVETKESPDRELFNLLGLSRPEANSYRVTNVYGSEADTSRTIELLMDMKQSNGSVITRRYQIIMLRMNDVWYIDPDSLNSSSVVKATHTPDPNMTPEPYVPPTSEPTYTPKPTVGPQTSIYYNTDGGKYYHIDANCKSVDKSYRPLQGVFMFAEINNERYKSLLRCIDCDAPSRPLVLR